MRRPLVLLLAVVLLLSACASPAAAPATQAPAAQPAQQKPAEAKPTEAPAAAAQPAPTTSAPLATALPEFRPPQSGGVLSPPTTVPTVSDISSVTSSQSPLEWNTYRDQVSGLTFRYPRDWRRQFEQGAQLVQRISIAQVGQSGGKNATLIIDVWKKQGELLAWLSTQIPTGKLLIGSAGLEGGSIDYQRFNASLSSQPTVFLYQPAKPPKSDRATLFTADKQYVYQFTYLGDTPDGLVNRAVYLHLLNTLIISGSTLSGLSLPSTGFTTGVDTSQFK